MIIRHQIPYSVRNPVLLPSAKAENKQLIFETHTPRPPFNSLIESIFHYKEFQPDHSIERVVPTGHAFVIFELDGMERHTFDNDTLKPNACYRSVWVSGVHRNYLSISAHQNSEMFVIQFKAFGAHPFLHLPMDQVANRVVAGSDILDGTLLRLRDDIATAATLAEKFSIADSWLESRYQEQLAAPKSIVKMVNLLQTQPAAKLNEIIDEFPGTQKHLISQFKKFVGITPKQFQRIVRFNDVLVQMQNDQFLSWSDIAHQCGYSDQSHFIREFRHFSGFNPETFSKNEFEDDAENFFPLDRDG